MTVHFGSIHPLYVSSAGTRDEQYDRAYDELPKRKFPDTAILAYYPTAAIDTFRLTGDVKKAIDKQTEVEGSSAHVPYTFFVLNDDEEGNDATAHGCDPQRNSVKFYAEYIKPHMDQRVRRKENTNSLLGMIFHMEH